MYSPKVLDHFRNPRNIGDLPDANGVGLVGAPSCGDVMKLNLKIEQVGEEERITEVKAKVFGCGAAIASTSFLTELIKGKSLAEAAAIENSLIAQELSLPPVKLHCSVLAEEALKAAIADYRRHAQAPAGAGAEAS